MADENYIAKLSKMSDRYGNPYLIGLMNYYNVGGLMELTQKQTKAYYEKIVKERGTRGHSKSCRNDR